MLLDAMLGEPPETVHPIVLMGLVISAFEKRALRLKSPRSRRLAGIVLAISVPSLVFVFSRKILSAAPRKPGWVMGTALLCTTLSMRGLGEAAEAVEVWLSEGRLERARTRVGHLVGRDTDDLSEKVVCRAAVYSLA
jgi:adenosylcobinamide-phosphate synthase